MSTVEIKRYRGRIEDIFKRGEEFINDLETQAHWAKYLCVMVSGFLEVSIRELYSQYSRSRAEPNVANFVEDELKSFQNPNMTKILALTREFSPQWAENLATAAEGELKDVVDSIVSNRNQIAHGKDVGITYVRVREYYRSTLKLLDLIDKQCNP